MSRDKSRDKGASPVVTSVMPVCVLVVICAVAGALLGVVHDMTAPVAAANAEERAQQTYAQLVADAASFESVPCDVQGCTAALRAVDDAGSTIAHVIVAESKGYGGEVPIAVAFGTDGTVMSITAMSNNETPGLGTRVADSSYIDQYVGMPAKPLTADDVDLISGATISSKAVLAAFDIAVEAYQEVQ